MDELKQSAFALSEYVKRMSASQALMLLGVTAGVIVGLYALTGYVGRVNYTALYSNLEPSVAGEVIEYLESNKIPYEISSGGQVIMAPDDQVYKIRMSLASQGLPGGGVVGYSLFDEMNFGMTEFLQKVNYKRAIEGELTRSILEINQVKAARVHIVIPKDRLFSKDQKETTASVLLKLSTGELTTRQMAGIKHLVSSSVEGLSPSNISIIDYNGNLLSDDNQDDPLASLSSSQLQARKQIEHYLEGKAQSMLDNVLGAGKSVVRISAQLDFTQVERTNELYDPNGAVVRSEERSEQSTNSSEMVPEQTSESSEGSKRETIITNYEIPKTIERVVSNVGMIERLSVAVMLDGVEEMIEDDEGNLVPSYSLRPQDEIDRLTAIVKSAVGYNVDRNDQIEVFNLNFNHDDLLSEDMDLSGGFDMYMALELARKLGGWLLILMVFLFLRKKSKSLFLALKTILPAPAPRPQVRQEDIQAQAIEDEPMELKVERRRPKLVDQMQETARDKPDELAKVIKTMMVSSD